MKFRASSANKRHHRISPPTAATAVVFDTCESAGIRTQTNNFIDRLPRIMEKKPPGAPIPISTQNSLSSTHHHPGWNDPPKWVQSGSPNSSTTPTKRVLNKRVAFPLGSTPPTANYDPNQPLNPPPTNMPPPPLTPVRLSSLPNHTPPLDLERREEPAKVAKEQAIEESMENFESVIKGNEELEKKGEDIGRRLNLMKTAWMEDKLDDTIRRKVLELSNALIKKDVESADKIHVSLMMEHAAICSSWIPGIRHMILATKDKMGQENPLVEDNPSPYFLPSIEVRKLDD